MHERFAELLRREPRARIYGIDHSELMVRVASRRNREPIERGAVTLWHADVDQIPLAEASCNKAIDLHSFQFWPNPVANTRNVLRILEPGASFILILRLRRDPRRAVRAVSALKDAGFASVRQIDNKTLIAESISGLARSSIV
jgi:ubiquinone/menaquinone biosynthesis C-methylase UbiE